MRKCIMLGLILIFLCSIIYSMNYITLKDGRVFSGQAIQRGDIVTISGYQGLFQFNKSEIEKMDGELQSRQKTEDVLKELIPEAEVVTEVSEIKDEKIEEEESVMEENKENAIVVMETNKGNIEIEIFQNKAPKTAENFLSLIEKEYYNGLIFHRVIENFMIQGGCPEGTGRGGPGYTIDDEFHPELKHNKKGILSMANAGPNTGGSQFFITLVPTPWLDGRHAIFGQIISGMDVVEAIGEVETDDSDRPIDTVIMEKVYIK